MRWNEMLIADLYLFCLFVWVLSLWASLPLHRILFLFHATCLCLRLSTSPFLLSLSLVKRKDPELCLLEDLSFFLSCCLSFIASFHVIRTNKAWDSFQDSFGPRQRSRDALNQQCHWTHAVYLHSISESVSVEKLSSVLGRERMIDSEYFFPHFYTL